MRMQRDMNCYTVQSKPLKNKGGGHHGKEKSLIVYDPVYSWASNA